MCFFFSLVQGVLSGIVISMATVCSIIVNAQYHIAQGDLKYSVIPTSTDGCSNETHISQV